MRDAGRWGDMGERRKPMEKPAAGRRKAVGHSGVREKKREGIGGRLRSPGRQEAGECLPANHIKGKTSRPAQKHDELEGETMSRLAKQGRGGCRVRSSLPSGVARLIWSVPVGGLVRKAPPIRPDPECVFGCEIPGKIRAAVGQAVAGLRRRPCAPTSLQRQGMRVEQDGKTWIAAASSR